MFLFLIKGLRLQESDLNLSSKNKNLNNLIFYLINYIEAPLRLRFKKTVLVHGILMLCILIMIIPTFSKTFLAGGFLLGIFGYFLYDKLNDMKFIKEEILQKSLDIISNNPDDIMLSDSYKLAFSCDDIMLGHDTYDYKYSPDINLFLLLENEDKEDVCLDTSIIPFYSYNLKNNSNYIIVKFDEDLFFVIPEEIMNK